MCTFSMVVDDWKKRTADQHPWTGPYLDFPDIKIVPYTPTVTVPPIEELATKAEVDALKQEIEALKKLLRAAGEYDAATGQPNCEQEEKIKALRILAQLLGVDMGDLLPAVSIPSVWVHPDQMMGMDMGEVTVTPSWSNNVSWVTNEDKPRRH